MIEPITYYRCTDCGKIYESKLEICSNCNDKIANGKLVGPFKIIKKLDLTRKILVECIICGFESEIDGTNIKRQVSCGCKPRYINIRNLTEKSIRYFCSRCGEVHVSDLPIFQYCCQEEDY